MAQVDRSIKADAKRFRWLLNGNGSFMEEEDLCLYRPCSEEEKDNCRLAISNRMLGDLCWAVRLRAMRGGRVMDAFSSASIRHSENPGRCSEYISFRICAKITSSQHSLLNLPSAARSMETSFPVNNLPIAYRLIKKPIRGGSWIGFFSACPSAYRFSNSTNYRFNIIGFRVCCFKLRAVQMQGREMLLRGGSWISCLRPCFSARRAHYSLGARYNIIGFRVVCTKSLNSGTTNTDRSSVLRGGSWDYNPMFCRSAYHNPFGPGLAINNVDFRVCCVKPSNN